MPKRFACMFRNDSWSGNGSSSNRSPPSGGIRIPPTLPLRQEAAIPGNTVAGRFFYNVNTTSTREVTIPIKEGPADRDHPAGQPGRIRPGGRRWIS